MLKPYCFAYALVVCALFPSFLCAQSTTAQITGTVSDATGAGVPAAQITVAGDENGLVRQTTTAPAGTFTVALLPPGKYHVTVVHDGFRPIAQSGLELLVDQVARLDFSLQVGDVSEKVEVAANASFWNRKLLRSVK